ncbi:MAG: phosphoribosylformylglycinamidine synthase subunit PurS [Geminicoccaceae bacterium]|nr:phosphoribosylformylglycinamidine synthase subunit PurS [Geminicoccaceae bacterium]MCB9942733.1 phosphoribosylformylglycinamidine synthase subunit PurS [Geminicoccaceae bacterium]
MKAIVSISLRSGVLDPEANAIAGALGRLGFDKVRSVRRVRQIELDLEISDRTVAEAEVKSMCDRLLANPVIEAYRIEMIG